MVSYSPSLAFAFFILNIPFLLLFKCFILISFFLLLESLLSLNIFLSLLKPLSHILHQAASFLSIFSPLTSPTQLPFFIFPFSSLSRFFNVTIILLLHTREYIFYVVLYSDNRLSSPKYNKANWIYVSFLHFLRLQLFFCVILSIVSTPLRLSNIFTFLIYFFLV